MEKELSAGAVIFRQDKTRQDKERLYLLLHYESGHWDFVKGHVEKDEREKETVRREAEEETGINDLNFIDGFRKSLGYFYKRDGNLVSKRVLFYIASTGQSKITLSYEHKGYKWLDYEKALEQLTFRNAREILTKAEKFLQKQDSQSRLDSFG